MIPNTAFGGRPNHPKEDEMTANDWNARDVQRKIGRLLGLADEDCNMGTYGDLNGDYDDETHDAYNRLIEVDPAFAKKISEDLVALALATHYDRLSRLKRD